jgi:hypothetical protein
VRARLRARKGTAALDELERLLRQLREQLAEVREVAEASAPRAESGGARRAVCDVCGLEQMTAANLERHRFQVHRR